MYNPCIYCKLLFAVLYHFSVAGFREAVIVLQHRLAISLDPTGVCLPSSKCYFVINRFYYTLLLLSQRELANALVSLGCLSSALELYEHLEMWEELAECLQSVGRTGRAEEVLRQQIAVNATPTLWCLLGDVTKVTLIERLAI